MHECNGSRNFVRIRRRRERFACLLNLRRSICDQSAASAGLDEGQMRELIGYLVACRGAEGAAARMAVGIPQQFLCEQSLCEEDGAQTGTPITIVYAPENCTDDAVEETAGAMPSFGVLDRGSKACLATGKGARRN
jgi:hypothetical protein